MTLTKKVFPYELVCRWSRTDGTFQGYHVKAATIIFEDGIEISRTESDALPLAQSDALGLTFDAVLKAIHVDALKAVDVAMAEKTKALADAESVAKERDAATKDASTARAEAVTAKAALADIRKK